MVLGTVEGDLHDIGKNLVAMMFEGAGFKVVDLGVDVKPAQFSEAIETHKPQILGLSALLTTTMPAMGKVIEHLKERGQRDQVKVLVGERLYPTILPRRSAQMAMRLMQVHCRCCERAAGSELNDFTGKALRSVMPLHRALSLQSTATRMRSSWISCWLNCLSRHVSATAHPWQLP